MIDRPDITVTITMHREGAYAIPALSSMLDLVERARREGLSVEAHAILDRVDEPTKQLVATRGKWLDAVFEVSFGDCGLTRNLGLKTACGEFQAFLDGDDLWGSDWLVLAHRAATAPNAPLEAIWHPEILYYFCEGDYEWHSRSSLPSLSARSFHMRHRGIDATEFDRDLLFIDNLWTANVFARRVIHQKFPYVSVDREGGLGFEDWTWNLETLWGGIPHLVVPDTVHLIRKKENGSLSQQNTVEGLLPYIADGVSLGVGRRGDGASI